MTIKGRGWLDSVGSLLEWHLTFLLSVSQLHIKLIFLFSCFFFDNKQDKK